MLKRKLIQKSLIKMPKLFYPIYSYWQGYNLKNLNLSKGIICISFDNDYSKDNTASSQLLPLFKDFDISVTWAVVGLWVEKYIDLHHRFLEDGHELMNHSWSHPDNSELRPGDKRKFSQITAEEVDYEIRKAHEFCLNNLGYKMSGFRMPHFSRHPAIAGVLKSLGYSYTSNHFALNAPTFGYPYITKEGWVEIPLSGIPRRPERIFETYRLFRAPDGLYNNENKFYKDFCEIIKFTQKNKMITCMYFDACDIVQLTNPTFSEYLKILKNSNVLVMSLKKAASILLGKTI